MNTPEDWVRRALRETAEDIFRTDVPLLRLPDGAGRGRLARGWRGWPPWLTPLAAAAAVAAASGVGRCVPAAQPMALEHRKVVGLDGRPVRGKTVGFFAPAGPIRFYQLRISSSGQVSALSPLPVPALPADADVSGLALTPDGRKLAVAGNRYTPLPGQPRLGRLSIFPVW